MRVTIEARHFNARDQLKEYVEKEVDRLTKYHDRLIDCQVILDGKLERKEAQVSLKVYGQTLVASETADKFEIAVEAAVDKLIIQLKKYKDKLTAKR